MRTLWILRHLLAIGVLPFTVTVLIPLWLARRNGTVLTTGATLGERAVQVAGAGLLLVGLVLFAASLRRFASEGRGTLAPWDPPRQLVVRGPYRHVRNPMISGVVFVLFGEGLALLSRAHFTWAVIFLGINALHIPLFEEPQLESRFGEAYRVYCRHVPRLFPRLRPWLAPADAVEPGVRLVLDLFARVWHAPHDLSAIDDLMTEDYVITSGGRTIQGREAFKDWVRQFQQVLTDARTESVEAFTNTAGDRVVSRWVCSGRHNGMLGLPANGRPISFTGIAIWSVRDGRLAECWVERSAWELYQDLTAEQRGQSAPTSAS